MSKQLTWETEFNTVTGFMIHTFSERVTVVTNIKTGRIKTLRDNESIDYRNDMPITEYEEYLISVAKDAAKLKEFECEEANV